MNINLGSNKNSLPDHVNVDIKPFKGVDVVCDCRETLPFKDNSLDGAFSHTFLEHIDSDMIVFLMKELARVCKSGSVVYHVVPFCRGEGAFGLNHKSFFSERSFECFYMADTEPIDIFDSKPFKLERIFLVFGKNGFFQWILWKMRVFWCGGALHVRLIVA